MLQTESGGRHNLHSIPVELTVKTSLKILLLEETQHFILMLGNAFKTKAPNKCQLVVLIFEVKRF